MHRKFLDTWAGQAQHRRYNVDMVSRAAKRVAEEVQARRIATNNERRHGAAWARRGICLGRI
jgi:hypothetical protein